MIQLRNIAALLLLAALPVASVSVRADQIIRTNVGRGIRLKAVQRNNAIQLSWSQVSGADGYRLYHQQGTALQADAAAWIDIAADQSSHLFSNVSPGLSYTFRLVTVSSTQEARVSIPVTVTLPAKNAIKPNDLGK